MIYRTENTYEKRVARMEAALDHIEGDRVPIAPRVGIPYAQAGGVSMYEALRDFRLLEDGLRRYLARYETDLYWAPAGYPIPALEILGTRSIRWPGAACGIPRDQSFQMPDLPCMEREEYPELIRNPGRFFLTKMCIRDSARDDYALPARLEAVGVGVDGVGHGHGGDFDAVQLELIEILGEVGDVHVLKYAVGGEAHAGTAVLQIGAVEVHAEVVEGLHAGADEVELPPAGGGAPAPHEEGPEIGVVVVVLVGEEHVLDLGDGHAVPGQGIGGHGAAVHQEVGVLVLDEGGVAAVLHVEVGVAGAHGHHPEALGGLQQVHGGRLRRHDGGGLLGRGSGLHTVSYTHLRLPCRPGG